MTIGIDPTRHSLVRIDPQAWQIELARWPDFASDPLVAGWATRSWPLVARRRCAGDCPGYIALGLPLPPTHGKRRHAVDMPDAAVVSVCPPPLLVDVRASAPNTWWQTIEALIDLAKEFAVEPRVFGSFAWSSLTGLAYVGSSSDLDLLWPLTPRTRELLPRLTVIEQRAPGRLDGEVIDEDGAGANWRELLGQPDDILVKTLTDVRLVKGSTFLRFVAVAA